MLEEKIQKEYIEAMKNRDTIKSTMLNTLRAEFMNAAIAKKKNKLDESEIIGVIRKQIKQHQDSIEQFTKGGRQDLVDKEEKELVVLKSYLPPELSEQELKRIIDEAIAAVGAQSLKDMGKVMKEVQAKVGIQADGRTVSALVQQKLSLTVDKPTM